MLSLLYFGYNLAHLNSPRQNVKHPPLKLIAICVSLATGLGIWPFAYAQNTNDTTSIRDRKLDELLGWVKDSEANNLCQGYYRQETLKFPKNLSNQNTVIHGKTASYFSDKPSILTGAIIDQPGRRLTANTASSILYGANWQSNTVYLEGNIHLYETGLLAIGDKGKVNVQNNTAELKTAIYRFSPSYIQKAHTAQTPQTIPTTATYKITGITARGEADRISQENANLLKLYSTTYTGCPPNNNSWHLQASKITLDRAAGVGTAVNTRIYIQDVPVFYFPYFNFPIDSARKSGFLYPSFGTNPTNGFFITIPYYWNLAPNYDLLTTPTIYTKRGLKLDNLFRYLSWDRKGQFFLSVLPNDKVFSHFQEQAALNSEYQTQPGYDRLQDASTDRAFASLQDQFIIDKYWRSTLNFNYVTDDYYFQDFSSNNTNDSPLLQNQMLQMGELDFDSRYWQVSGLIENYQTLHPVNNASIIPDQYADFPRINFNANYPETLDYKLNGELVNFQNPLITGNYQNNLPDVIGQRYNLDPGISLPLYGASYHFVPTAQFDLTAYKLTNRFNNQPTEITREVPILDIDTGLYFQRPFSAFGNNYYQTLEPRLYYLYVPYHNQDDIPTFDTATQTFAYDSIFQNNRFNSIDRINDADQLGYGITSRFINRSTGLDRLNASVGQIIYFANRKVVLDDVNSLNNDNQAQLSPLVGQLSMQLLDHWSATGYAAYKIDTHYFNNAGAFLQYIGDSMHVFSIGYNFLKLGDPLPNSSDPLAAENNLNQIQVASTWRVNQRWSLYTSINYNISHRYNQNYLYGFQYDNCCWAIRLVATRTLIGLNTANNPNYSSGVALQFALKGLGSSGTHNVSSVLNTYIPGYVDQFSQSSSPIAQQPIA